MVAHGGASVLDLHDFVAAHVARLDEAEGVEDAERREDADVALGEHGGRGACRRGEDGRSEGDRGNSEREHFESCVCGVVWGL